MNGQLKAAKESRGVRLSLADGFAGDLQNAVDILRRDSNGPISAESLVESLAPSKTSVVKRRLSTLNVMVIPSRFM